MQNEILIFGQNASWLEILAMLTGIAGVWLTMKENIWCFPVGIINVSLYAWLFLTPGIRLYADALLQCIYILLLFYGWMNWADSNKKKESRDTYSIQPKTALRLSVIVLMSTVVLAIFLQTFTNASFPWLDSALTCISLGAQWMIAKKLIENWIVWIVVDIVYLPLYFVKHLPLTTFLYAIFLLMAIKGYREWKKNLIVREA